MALKRNDLVVHKLPEYQTWSNMKDRCYNPNYSLFHRYGGRGIRVCERWRTNFLQFYKDMGPKPSPKHSIDRYPNRDGDYKPSNCRWATPREQSVNRDCVKLFEANGKKMTLPEWEEETGIERKKIWRRLMHGWPMDLAICPENQAPQSNIGKKPMPYSKLTQRDVLAIRKSKKSWPQLARDYGVNHSTIERIVKRKTWKWVD